MNSLALSADQAWVYAGGVREIRVCAMLVVTLTRFDMQLGMGLQALRVTGHFIGFVPKSYNADFSAGKLFLSHHLQAFSLLLCDF